MTNETTAFSIIRFHDGKLVEPAWPADDECVQGNGFWCWIEENHRCNTLLWNEEDKARRTDAGDAAIAENKRRIDRLNQKRNDATEAIDEVLLAELDACPRFPDARLHSETAGAMIDRLSILALKIFHMREQTLRHDADELHRQTCRDKLARLHEQREDLGSCLDALLDDARHGRAYFKRYRQFKMYNDPALNPYLYRQGALSSPCQLRE